MIDVAQELIKLFQRVADEDGVLVHDVAVDWFDAASMSNPNGAVVREVKLVTSTKPKQVRSND